MEEMANKERRVTKVIKVILVRLEIMVVMDGMVLME